MTPLGTLPVFLIMVACWATPATAADTTNAAASVDTVELKNDVFSLAFGPDGRPRSLKYLPDRRELLDPANPGAGFLVTPRNRDWTVAGDAIRLNRVTCEGNELTAASADGRRAVHFDVRAGRGHVALRIRKLEGFSLDETVALSFDIRVNISGKIAEAISTVRGGDLSVGILSLDYMTWSSAGSEGASSSLRAEWPYLWHRSKEDPLGGFLLYVCPEPATLETIGQIEVEEHLPHPMHNGQWAKINNGVSRLSQIWFVYTPNAPSQARQAMEYVRQSGLRMFYLPQWLWQGPGVMCVRDDYWPGGIAGLRKFSDDLRGRGILLGIHTGSASIFAQDPILVCPKPDDRLATWGKGRLAQSVGPSDKVIYFQPEPGVQRPIINPGLSPLRPPVFGWFWNADWIRIGDEIINVGRFEDTDKPTWRLTQCRRGASGTKVAPHSPGDPVRGLLQAYGTSFVPDVESTLFTEFTDQLARLVNEARIARISFDALEFSDYDGYWASNKFMLKTFEKLDRPVACESSAGIPQYQWHLSSYMNVGEGMHTLPRGYWESYIEKNCEYAHRNFLPAALGAFTFRLDRPEQLASSPDEWEWQLAKAAAWDGCFFFETSMDFFRKHGQTDRILELVRHWEDARVAGVFTPRQREQMKACEMSFRLATGKDTWSVTPVKIQTHYPQASGQSVPLENPFGRQALRFEARVLPGFDYDDPNNIALLPEKLSDLKIPPGLTICSTKGKVITGRQGGEHQARRDPTIEDYLAIMGTGSTGAGEKSRDVAQPASAAASGGAHTLLLSAANDKPIPSGPVQADWQPASPYNLMQHRGVGMWVTGDGKGEFLFVELEGGSGNMVRKYVVKIDFTGRRYIEIPTGLIASETYYHLWSWYNGWRSIKLGFDYGLIQRISLGFVAIPPNTQVHCVVETPKALAEDRRPLKDLTLAIKDRSLTVRGSVDTDEYLVYEGGNEAEVLDANRHHLRSLPVSGKDWSADGGGGSVTVTSQGPSPYLRLQLKPLGEPFTIPDPTDKARQVYDEIVKISPRDEEPARSAK